MCGHSVGIVWSLKVLKINQKLRKTNEKRERVRAGAGPGQVPNPPRSSHILAWSRKPPSGTSGIHLPEERKISEPFKVLVSASRISLNLTYTPVSFPPAGDLKALSQEQGQMAGPQVGNRRGGVSTR